MDVDLRMAPRQWAFSRAGLAEAWSRLAGQVVGSRVVPAGRSATGTGGRVLLPLIDQICRPVRPSGPIALPEPRQPWLQATVCPGQDARFEPGHASHCTTMDEALTERW